MSALSIGQAPSRDSTEARDGAAPAAASTPPRAGSTLPLDEPACPSASLVAVELPMALRALGNRREHHLARARRVRREQAAVLGALAGLEPPPLPVVVVLVRVGWNRLDVDGLVAACKAPIDALALWLGVDDRDRRVRWHLAQSFTRERRLVRRAGTLRREAASALRIVARPWQPSDGDDPLRVLAEAPAVGVKP